MRPTFSLIIPTRNRADALAENLKRLGAVAAELPDDVEIIVADNASTDRTPDVVADRSPEVQLIRLDENLSTAARNVAAESARGSVLVMLDDDSYLQAPDLLRNYYIESLNMTYEQHLVAANWSDEQIDQQLALIDKLRNATSSPVALSALEEAEQSLLGAG